MSNRNEGGPRLGMIIRVGGMRTGLEVVTMMMVRSRSLVGLVLWWVVTMAVWGMNERSGVIWGRCAGRCRVDWIALVAARALGWEFRILHKLASLHRAWLALFKEAKMAGSYGYGVLQDGARA